MSDTVIFIDEAEPEADGSQRGTMRVQSRSALDQTVKIVRNRDGAWDRACASK